MANKKGHRRFGFVRKLPSGRFQASYLGPDGMRRYAPDTFPTKTDATAWLSGIETDMLRGDWVDPQLGRANVQDYGGRWIKDRPLSQRTVELYESLLRLHIVPFLGAKELGEVSTETVRAWRTWMLDNGRSASTAAKAYRLLRAIMNTALDDGRIKRNPCRIKGADQEKTEERPVATVAQVYALAKLMPARFMVLILMAAFTGLRWGELIALRQRDLDLEALTVRVSRKFAQLGSGEIVTGSTKSAAGVRTVALPGLIMPDLLHHLANFVGPGDDALIFTGEKGAVLKRGNWRETVAWVKSVAGASLPEGFHFHDLRHTGNHLAAASGASTRELMHRMGHGSMRAALIYQHATSERDREIADELSRRAVTARKKAEKKARKQAKKDQKKGRDEPDDGAAGVLVPAS
ncbi:MAG TPA: tyrosine-type recombinase/integrase [Pseudonocardiaceae bacterium]|nr:tyrosine-type recombinase/integrase [Pseudonocardiaceae bacterium]